PSGYAATLNNTATATPNNGDKASGSASETGLAPKLGVPMLPTPAPLPPLPPLPPSKQFLLSSTASVDPPALSPRLALPPAGPVPAYLAVGSGPGYPATVRVFDYTTGVERFRFFPYGPAFTGGVNVATGDVTGDGVPDILTGVRSGA